MFIQVTTHTDQKPKININNINAIIDNQIHFSGGLVLDLTKESIKEIELIIAPKNKNTKPKEVDIEALQLFQKLHELTGGKGKAIFSLQREKKLKDLLTKHRMTEEQLIKSATNIGQNAFLQGANDGNGGKGQRYGTIDYLLRPDKATQWADAEEEKKKGMF